MDLRQLLAVLTLPQSGLKSSLVDRVWKAAKVERVKDWSTALPRYAGASNNKSGDFQR